MTLENKILKILSVKQFCFIASTNGTYVDNALVAYCADHYNLYFGTFNNTLKGRFISNNPYIAVCIENLQIHGTAAQITYHSKDFPHANSLYYSKFPQYKHYSQLENNDLYLIKPLVIWHYDLSGKMMSRDKIIFNQKYYNDLKPYEAPEEFNKRGFPSN